MVKTNAYSVPVRAGHETATNGVIEVVGPGRRGYAFVAGHDVSIRGGVVIEQGLANAWGLSVGDRISVYDSPPLPIVGLARAPDDVAYQLDAPTYTSRSPPTVRPPASARRGRSTWPRSGSRTRRSSMRCWSRRG